MNRSLLSLFACFFALPLFGQYDRILADPTVTWAVEIELLLSPEEFLNDWPADSLNRSTVLKTVNAASPDPMFPDPPGLNERLFQVMREGRWPVFDGEDLNKPISLEALDALLGQWDTVVSFDPENYDNTSFIIQHVIAPSDCPLVRVRQLLFYREKTVEFGVLTRAIGPTLANGRTLFWLSMPQADQPVRKSQLRLNSPEITWARRISTRAASPEIKGLPSLKRPDQRVVSDLLFQVRDHANVEVLDMDDWAPMSLEDRERIFTRVDTVVLFDPGDFEERVKVVRFELNPDVIHQLRLVEDWYWDEKRHRLLTRLVAVAPMLDVYSEDGEFRYSRPLFYRKSKR